MYRMIKTDGTAVGSTDAVRYIKISSSGCFVESGKENAVGIAYKGTAYNLFGHDEISGADQVLILEQDSAQIVTDHDERLTVAENAALDLDMAYDSRVADVEDALCDLDNALAELN